MASSARLSCLCSSILASSSVRLSMWWYESSKDSICLCVRMLWSRMFSLVGGLFERKIISAFSGIGVAIIFPVRFSMSVRFSWDGSFWAS